MVDITQKLPPELLMEILGHVPVRDVLKFKQVRRNPLQDSCAGECVERSRYLQVNRVFHDAVLASPLIQHKIDLFAAGLEYNAAAGIDLVESRKAFLQYSSSVDLLHPIEEKVVGEVQSDGNRWSKTAGGVLAIFADSVRLFALGSASRGISYKEWKIQPPIDNAIGFHICPAANLIVFIGPQTSRCAHRSQELLSRTHPNVAAVVMR